MYSNDAKDQFLELRATGLSLARIASDLHVSQRTLVDWNRQLAPDIRALRALHLEALHEQTLTSREADLARLAKVQTNVGGQPERLGQRLIRLAAEAGTHCGVGLHAERAREDRHPSAPASDRRVSAHLRDARDAARELHEVAGGHDHVAAPLGVSLQFAAHLASAAQFTGDDHHRIPVEGPEWRGAQQAVGDVTVWRRGEEAGFVGSSAKPTSRPPCSPKPRRQVNCVRFLNVSHAGGFTARRL
jgi:hypothetical protein